MHMGFSLIWMLLPGILIAYAGYKIAASILNRRKSRIAGHGPEQIGDGISDAAVFRLAEKKGGELSVADVIIELNVSRAEAEKKLEALCDEIHVSMIVDAAGRVRYRFPDLRNSGE